MDQDLYQRIIMAYKQTGSVDRTAEICGTYAIKVRKVLITEGLWHSKKSDAVNSLRNRGYSASEIAETLGMDEKNVQFYLPYADPTFSSDKHSSQARVSDFRGRGRKAAEGNLFREGIKSPEKQKTGKAKKVDKADRTEKAEAVEKVKGLEETAKGKRHDKIPTPEKAGVRKKAKRKIVPDDWSAYRLHVELVRNNYLSAAEDERELFRDEEDVVSLRKLLKTRSGIFRDVIVPGKMSLHQLSYVIQELFGFMNNHLHHFSLPKALLGRLTNGEVSKWAEMCGSLLRVPVVEDFSDLYWDDDYHQGKSLRNWKRSKYIGEQMDYAVGETYIDSLRLLKEEADLTEHVMREKGDLRRFQDLSMEEYIREYAVESETNSILERLKVEDLFLREGSSLPDPDTWRENMRRETDISLSYLKAFRETESFTSLTDAMDVLRMMREDRSALDQAIWLNRDEVRESVGRNPDEILELTEAEIHRLERQIGKAMHAFDPPVWPVTDTLYYHYDYGDDWLFRITCTEIFFQAEEEPDEQETEAAFRRVEGMIGSQDPEMDEKLKACRWGKNYMEEYTFLDSRGKELHDMLYIPLCDCLLEEKPVCVCAEGVPLVEDVGGVDGFFDFIRTIHGEDAEEAASLRTWARGLGWKEIIPKAEKLL